jgi:hypothetical protein
VLVGSHEDGFHDVRVYIRAILYGTVAPMHEVRVSSAIGTFRPSLLRRDNPCRS